MGSLGHCLGTVAITESPESDGHCRHARRCSESPADGQYDDDECGGVDCLYIPRTDRTVSDGESGG